MFLICSYLLSVFKLIALEKFLLKVYGESMKSTNTLIRNLIKRDLSRVKKSR